MNIDVGLLSLIILGLMLLLMTTGLPVAFVLLAISGIGFLVIRGPSALDSMSLATFSYLTKDVFLAVPAFIFMASVLEISGLGTAMYDTMHKWMAGLRGGLAMGTLGISTVLAAMSGSGATATISMGLLAYPEMEKRGYDKRMTIGCIPAGGSLGPLIPPSVTMIIVGAISYVSIGKLFIAGIIPGLLTAFGYIAYIGIRCFKNPKMGPVLPLEKRVSWIEKLKALRTAGMPIVLILLVLGMIYLGVATPSEAGGLGAFGALICAAIYGNLTFKNLHIAATRAMALTAMLLWLVVTGGCFSQLLSIIGIQGYLQGLLLALPVSPMIILLVVLGGTFVLGMFIEGAPVIIIVLPIVYPVIRALGFDLLWFNLVFTMDIILGGITPPFGLYLFFFKGLNIAGVSIVDIYRAIIPYVLVLILSITVVILVPELATWLPGQMITH